MRIGILTFHSQLNYGGILQCWALQTVLEKLGHEAVVIDRWQDSENALLECGYDKYGWKDWLKFGMRALFGLGDNRAFMRVRRTKSFMRRRLKLTPYHFVEWKDAPKDLGVDRLVVGSDQVWHCGDFGDPRVYLLDGAPETPAVAYAASFGMVGLPDKLGGDAVGAEDLAAEPIYRHGLSRFNAISCREREGVEICRGLGFDAFHVVDPTLLAWGKDASKRVEERKNQELVCYFLSERIEDCTKMLHDFARKNSCRVKVFLGGTWFAPFPSNPSRINCWLKRCKIRFDADVDVVDDAGPEEFFKAFQNAKWVVSDSFHALMFSVCNGCNVRMIRPASKFRRKMFARIEEFAAHTKGQLIADSLVDALDSIGRRESVKFDYDWIELRRRESSAWLQDNLR